MGAFGSMEHGEGGKRLLMSIPAGSHLLHGVDGGFRFHPHKVGGIAGRHGISWNITLGEVGSSPFPPPERGGFGQWNPLSRFFLMEAGPSEASSITELPEHEVGAGSRRRLHLPKSPPWLWGSVAVDETKEAGGAHPWRPPNPTHCCPTEVGPYPGKPQASHPMEVGPMSPPHSPAHEVPGFPGIDHLGDAPHKAPIRKLQVVLGVPVEVATRSAEAVDHGGPNGERHGAFGAEEHIHA